MQSPMISHLVEDRPELVDALLDAETADVDDQRVVGVAGAQPAPCLGALEARAHAKQTPLEGIRRDRRQPSRTLKRGLKRVVSMPLFHTPTRLMPLETSSSRSCAQREATSEAMNTAIQKQREGIRSTLATGGGELVADLRARGDRQVGAVVHCPDD